MHTLANCRSGGLSSSSKTSRNGFQSAPSGSTGIGVQESRSNILTQKSSAIPARKGHPEEIGDDFDTSDTDSCESVGSNSPAFEGACCESRKNSRDGRLDQTHPTSPLQPDLKSRCEDNAGNSHLGTQQPGKVFVGRSTRGTRCRSTVPNADKDASRNVVTPGTPQKEHCNAPDVSLQKHSPRVGDQGPSRLTQETLKKVSSTGNTNCSSARKVGRDCASIQRDSGGFIEKSESDHISSDEGDGGGPASASNSRHAVSKCDKMDAPSIECKDVQDQLDFDDGDGGGYIASRYVPTRKGRLRRHARRSRERSGRTKTESRAGSGGSTTESTGGGYSSRRSGHPRHSRSNGGSRGASQGSSRHSSRGQKRHMRKERRCQSHRSRSQSSRSGTESAMDEDGRSLIGHKPYPANWRCFGRRPPAIHEFRPLGEVRLRNVRPAGKLGYLVRNADERPGCRGQSASDVWDNCYGLAKPLTCQWSTPLPYGTKVIRAGDIDPSFHPSRGDTVIINPAQNFYLAMKSGYVMTYGGQGYSFGVGDLIVRLGRFMPKGEYIPYGNLELYMHTQTREMRLLGSQPFLLVDFNYHNLDYESPGKHLAIGTFLNETFFPRRGDIVIRKEAWAENYPNVQRKHHSSVQYWRPRMEFLPNDMLLRPYVDIGCKQHRSRGGFYWGAAELYTYSGKGLAWAYWGRDDHCFDTPYPREKEHGIKTGHHKDEVGHYGDGLQQVYGDGGGHAHGHQANDGCHTEHELSRHHGHRSSHGHHAKDACHNEHDRSRHSRS